MRIKKWKKSIVVACMGFSILGILIWGSVDWKTIGWLETGQQDTVLGDVSPEDTKSNGVGNKGGKLPKSDGINNGNELQENVNEGETKKIALTFDDGPHPSYTEELLDGLKERGVRATFFVLGEHAELHPDIIKQMYEEGHLIGNHTYSHLQLKKGNWETYKEELIRTNEIIREITGAEVEYARPPYGSWDKSFEEELNMFPVLWTVDSRDWCSTDCSGVAKKVVSEVEEGDIILMHDYYGSTVTAALKIVDELIAEGYTFVTVDEILFD